MTLFGTNRSMHHSEVLHFDKLDVVTLFGTNHSVRHSEVVRWQASPAWICLGRIAACTCISRGGGFETFEAEKSPECG